ncbi:hypothetical protein J4221_05445 [Candidatus Pacearchaeota archaeon]|nr:hypothetical protein [Candidatus Pacearchaeota archaeon]
MKKKIDYIDTLIRIIFVIIELIVHLYYKFGAFDNFIINTFPRFERSIEKSFDRIKQDTNLIKDKLKV